MCAAFPITISTFPPIEADAITPYQRVPVNSWQEAKEHLFRYERQWIYRGQRDASWMLETTFERDVLAPLRTITLNPPKHAERQIFANYERILIGEFKKGAHLYFKDFPRLQHTLEWLALMQHYGAPTRLLDFTESPYVAAFFAFRDPGDNEERAIWILNSEACAAAARTKYSQDERLRYQIYGDNGPMHRVTFNQDLANDEFFMKYLTWAPYSDHSTVVPLTSATTNDRMLVQQGIFVMPSNITVSFMENIASIARVEGQPILHQLIIPSSERMLVLADLDRMNINDLSLFPGLEGYARFVSRRLLLRQATAFGQVPSRASAEQREEMHAPAPDMRETNES